MTALPPRLAALLVSAAPAALAEVKDAIVRSLRQQKAAENARAYIHHMQSREPVELNEIVRAHVSAN